MLLESVTMLDIRRAVILAVGVFGVLNWSLGRFYSLLLTFAPYLVVFKFRHLYEMECGGYGCPFTKQERSCQFELECQCMTQGN